MCFLSYLVLLIKILLSCVTPLRSPLKTAYLRVVFSQCHQFLTKLSFKAPPRTALPVGVYRTGASKMHQCFFLLHFIFSTFRSNRCYFSSVLYHFHSAIIVIYSFPTVLLSRATVISFRLDIFFIYYFFSNIHGTSVATDAQNRFLGVNCLARLWI